jgi:glycosyltransferase involved in cell wall biosynthesis
MNKLLVEVLIPTFNREYALLMCLTSLYYQNYSNYRIIVADQNESIDVDENKAVVAVRRLLAHREVGTKVLKNLPRLGMSQQRQFLLEKSRSKYILFLDDDVWLEPFAIRNLVMGMLKMKCGYIGMGLIGLSYIDDIRPKELKIEFWKNKVKPEKILPKSRKWERHILHNAANVFHVAKKYNISILNPEFYKVAWVGGCVLYDREKLIHAGGFEFDSKIPIDHVGEDVMAQLRIMERDGGCGILPSGAYHMELPTTINNRDFDLPKKLID